MSAFFQRAFLCRGPNLISWGGLAAAVAVFLGANPSWADPAEHASHIGGIFLGTDAGTGIYGYDLVGSLGARYQDLRSLGGRKYVLQWNAGTDVVGGVLANAHPYNPLFGGRAQAGGELGIRFMPTHTLSPYLSASLGLNGHAITIPGVPVTALNTVNNSDGIAGLAGTARARLNLGGSILDTTHSVMMLAYVQDELRSPQSTAPATNLVGGGIRVQGDIAHNLTTFVDASLATTGQQTDTALHTQRQTVNWAVAGGIVKTLGTHWLVGGSLSLSRDGTTITTAGGAHVFDTADPLNATIHLEVGYAP